MNFDSKYLLQNDTNPGPPCLGYKNPRDHVMARNY